MELSELVQRTGELVAIPAAIGFVLLLPLYLSQRRDLARLRVWMEREPEHPVADLRASEALLDRAERELERLPGKRGEAAARVAADRPALARITLERAALDPPSRWRLLVGRLSQPRILIAIALAAVLIGGGAIVATERLLSGGTSDGSPAPSFDRSQVTVSVLNGTAVAGLAGKVQSDLAASGYRFDAVGASPAPAERTVVMFRRGRRPAAVMVARDLGVRTRDVEPIDRVTRRLAGDAGVVVIAGEDRAR